MVKNNFQHMAAVAWPHDHDGASSRRDKRKIDVIDLSDVDDESKSDGASDSSLDSNASLSGGEGAGASGGASAAGGERGIQLFIMSMRWTVGSNVADALTYEPILRQACDPICKDWCYQLEDSTCDVSDLELVALGKKRNLHYQVSVYGGGSRRPRRCAASARRSPPQCRVFSSCLSENDRVVLRHVSIRCAVVSSYLRRQQLALRRSRAMP